jgi:5,10-methylenetetrahydromethanopterin reductase
LVEFGLGLQSDRSADEYVRLTRLAEEYGFDVLTVFGDLMYQPPVFPLLLAARHSRRLRLGPSCLNPYTLHPVEIAGQLAALDLASGGRAYLGLARGAWLASAGLEQPRPVRRLREAVEVVQRLLAQDTRGYRGEIYMLAPGLALRYAPARARVPLLIGTWSTQTAALAGEIADEVKIGGSANPAMIARMREMLAPGLQRAQRSESDVGIVIGAVTVVGEDGAAARRLARTRVAQFVDVVGELDGTVTMPPDLMAGVRQRVGAGDHEGAGALIPDAVLDRFAMAGTPEQVAAQVRSLVDAGARRVEFGSPHGLTAEEGVRLLGERVLPLVQARMPQV